MPHVQFVMMDVDALTSDVRDVLVGEIQNPNKPLLSQVGSGLVLVFQSTTGTCSDSNLQ